MIWTGTTCSSQSPPSVCFMRSGRRSGVMLISTSLPGDSLIEKKLKQENKQKFSWHHFKTKAFFYAWFTVMRYTLNDQALMYIYIICTTTIKNRVFFSIHFFFFASLTWTPTFAIYQWHTSPRWSFFHFLPASV